MKAREEIQVAAALAESGGRVFLARRGKHKSSGGLWELPGGKVESGENAASALARELMEELALDSFVDSEPYQDSRKEVNGRSYRFLVFRARWEGLPVASTDHDLWGYYLPDEIPFGELAPLDEDALLRWAEEARGMSSRLFSKEGSS